LRLARRVVAGLQLRAVDLARRWELDPRKFVVIYLASVLPYYAGGALAVAGIAATSLPLLATGVAVNRAAWAWPYVYVWRRGKLPVALRALVLVWVVVAGVAGGLALLR
jgi:hypothetical protein